MHLLPRFSFKPAYICTNIYTTTKNILACSDTVLDPWRLSSYRPIQTGTVPVKGQCREALVPGRASTDRHSFSAWPVQTATGPGQWPIQTGTGQGQGQYRHALVLGRASTDRHLFRAGPVQTGPGPEQGQYRQPLVQGRANTDRPWSRAGPVQTGTNPGWDQ